MRRAKRKFMATNFMVDDDKQPTFDTRKQRDDFHGVKLKEAVEYNKHLSKLVVRASPLFNKRINYLIRTGKVKVFNSLKEFYERRN